MATEQMYIEFDTYVVWFSFIQQMLWSGMADTKLSNSDISLLSTIKQLTETNSGRPPSLAEIASAQGLQVSSRGNIQRQLSRLRPQYVDWGKQARSLRLTQLAESVLDMRPAIVESPLKGDAGVNNLPCASDSVPLSAEIIILIASGLTKLAADVAEGRPPQAPYPDAWRRGWDRLAAECILRSVPFPTTTPEAIAWCQELLSNWPVRFDIPQGLVDTPLLEGDQPTPLCRELAFERDAELQASEQSMKRVLDEARLSQMPDAYVAVRRFVIEHPVVEYEELADFALDPEIGRLGSYVNDMYEKVPSALQIGQDVLTCGNCGWTLELRKGALQCGDRRCAVLTDRFSEGTGRLTYLSGLWRVRRAIRRYIVAPGKHELDLAHRLEALGLRVELWPYFDAYDLRIVFDGSLAWAVDVKDWQHPAQLGRRLGRIPKPGTAEWQSAFYVIPDQRLRENANYLTVLRSAATYSGAPIVSVSELLRLAADQSQNQGEIDDERERGS